MRHLLLVAALLLAPAAFADAIRVIPAPSAGGGGAVSSVFGRTGAVAAAAADYAASQVTNTPAGTVAATTVQTAIDEVASESEQISRKNAVNGYVGLDGSSNATVSGTISGGKFFLTAGGDATNPGLALSTDANTGVAWTAADTLALTIGGTYRWTFTTTTSTTTLPVVVPSGSVSAASLRAADADTGIFFTASDQQVKIAANGVEALQLTSSYVYSGLSSYVRGVATNSTSSVGLSVSTGSNIMFSNTGASAIIRFTLPTGDVDGTEFCFTVTDTDGIRIRPGTSQSIRDAATTVSVSQDLTSTTVGDSVCMKAIADSDVGGVSTWVVISLRGAGWSII